MSEKEVITTEPSGGVPENDGSKKQTKKKKGVGFKILIVVVVVIVVIAGGGGIAYGVFHSNPKFCNFICHTPMDPYVESFLENKSINPMQADNTAPLSVTNHKNSDKKLVCLDCHQDGLDAQIREGLAWISGNYELPLDLRIIYKQPKEDSTDRSGLDFCLRPECHEGVASYDDLKKITADMERNPHNNHNGNQNCFVCHQTHEQSVMFCTQCHSDSDVPEGWLTYKQAEDQKKAAKKQ